MEDEMKADDNWPPSASYDVDNINRSALSLEKFVQSHESLISNGDIGIKTGEQMSVNLDTNDSMV